MIKEPDIIKELREAEKFGLLHNMDPSTIKELEVADDPEENTSDQANYIVQDWGKRINENEIECVEDKYKTIFENYAIAITLVDNKERIVSWNKYTEELLNMAQSDLYLKSVNLLYPPEEWQKIREENVRRKGIKYRMETRMIKKNQGNIDVELSLCILKGKEGKTIGSVGIIKDITKQKETEKALKTSEERYRTIFENSAVAITLTDENERIVSWNKYTEDLLGVDKEDLNLKPVESLYPPYEWQKIRAKNIRKKGLQHHIETKMVKKNNEIIDVNLSLSVLKNHEGKVIGSIGVTSNITERKQSEDILKKSEEKFRNLAEYSPNMIFINKRGRVVYANMKCEEIMGYKREEFYSPDFDFLTLIAPESNELIKTSFRLHMNNEDIASYEYKLITKDGKKIEAIITTKLIKYEEDTAILGIVTSIDKQKKTEEELRTANRKIAKFNQELERRVEARTAEVKKLLNQKDEFIQQLGHDLKSPLTPLVGLLPLLEKTEKDPKSMKLFEILHRNIDCLKNIVFKTLELAELNTPDTPTDLTEDINLREEAEKTIKDQQMIFDDKGFKIENKIRENIFVKADRVRLYEVFNNLIINAVKYSPYGGNVTIDAFVDGDYITVSIIDSGVGMTEEQLKRIFDEFFKADKSRHDINSSGLGLSICKRIVEKHGGRIWAESSGLGEGSAFYFTIPIGSKKNIGYVLKGIKNDM